MEQNQPKTQKYVIEGVLRTITPLHITLAGASARWDPAKNRKIYGEKGGFPLTLLRRAPFFLGRAWKPEGTEDSQDPAKSMRDEWPVIPASTFRGMLRRGAASIIEDYFVNERNTLLSYETYQGMHSGAVSGNPDKAPPPSEEIISARVHPFYGIFGGGPRMLRGNLIAENAIPLTDEFIKHGYVPQRYFDSALTGVRADNLVVANQVLRKDDFLGAGASDHASHIVENYDAIYAAKRDEALVEAAKKMTAAAQTGQDDVTAEAAQEDGESSARGIRAMSFREDVVSGVPFYVRFVLDGTQAQLGLLLGALERTLNAGIGGRVALGYGRTSGSLSLAQYGGDSVMATDVIRSNGHGYEIVAEAAGDYMSALNEALEVMTMEDLQRYMLPTVVPDSDAKTKKKKP